ncbi:histidine protein methyltransferase 1 homolog isoform X1 [Macrobrachium rosenbergii]|uniref:histidine protein methyltransferase 1 homolog isoform X1 n=1 Tax=Macrobrachium rosenbergii TaxID=79674 RepID=UPI0034D67057
MRRNIRMFQFNFNVEGSDNKENTESQNETVKPEKKWLKALCHTVTDRHLHALSEENMVEEITIGQTVLRYLSMSSALGRLQKMEALTDILPLVTDNTDLVPAVYEGGLKIWECTWDLLEYMESSCNDLKGCRVLELGCGAGLPAIYAMLHGAHITLQDYNEEVINYVAIPNVLLNSTDISVLEDGNPETFGETIQDVTSKSCYYSGDWGELDKLFASKTEIDHKFDFILTSETIYNQECHEKLLTLMTNNLKQNGKILLAAKTYYFGVGGGILQFCDLIKKKGNLNIKTVYTHEEGVKREIIELTFKAK